MIAVREAESSQFGFAKDTYSNDSSHRIASDADHIEPRSIQCIANHASLLIRGFPRPAHPLDIDLVAERMNRG